MSHHSFVSSPWSAAARAVFRLGLAGVAVAAVLAGCSKPEAAPEPVRAVKVLTVAASDMQARLEFPGEVRARTESALSFRVAGKIIRRQAELGQRVKVGDVLAQLDPQDYKLAADAAQAQLTAATTSRDLASADYKRYKELKEQNFISGAELERRDSALKSAQAQVQQAQAQLASSGNQAVYTRLVSDVAGVVTAVSAEPGQVVSGGTPVVKVAQDGARDVVFVVPEDRVAGVALGSSVEVRVWASDTKLVGKVREVAASADPVTRTFQVKVGIDAATAPALGATVNVVPQSLGHAGQPVIKLPTSALRQEANGSTAVWVLDTASMTVKAQTVVVATADGNEAVIASGLQPGMQVVSAGVHVLAPGQKVVIYQQKTAPAQSVPAQAATNTVAKPVAAPASAVQ
ncbi:RND family efflux transporter MFP subunit [Rhodoferax ferrireducens]|uniref:RND family efflux transporter MFP subunit n=1 Tax=Rhodoferax ferrireducens TaxID=192843 RepID=A0ABU2C8D2_9BURK|nr:efflux RND transporter periplasmic adaptor subunit [Rhodoferax ferrireducens]MDR7377592.1 RND family efflux transporter MFP subunit [Rhodoferax ferrireducens]